MQYNEIRNKVMNVANQKLSMIIPIPMDIYVEKEYEGEDGGED